MVTERKGLEHITPESADYLTQHMQAQLQRSTATDDISLRDWTLKHRTIGGVRVVLPPSQTAIYDDVAAELVIMKGTQIFISEYLVNLSLWALDTKFGGRGNVLYTMPTQVQMDDFSQSRMDKAIEESVYLKQKFSKALVRNQTNRTRLKHLGGSSLYMRGSDSLKQLISVDADIVIDDEVDWFTEDTVEWSKERLGSAKSPLFRAVSKPTYPGQGIHLLWQESDQREWHIRCEHCAKWQPIDWWENIDFEIDKATQTVLEVAVLCSACRCPINRLADGEWVAAFPGRLLHGYHVSRLQSPFVDLRKMAEDSLRVTDIPKVQSFFNSGLGLPYAPKGGRLDESELLYDPDLEFCRAGQGFGGVDVGLKLHTCVTQNLGGGLTLTHAAEFDTFEELDIWFTAHNIRNCIIDARGDPRATVEWADRHPGRVYRWLHVESTADTHYNEETGEVRLNRTSLLDNLYARCRSGYLRLPLQVKSVPGFIPHLKALVRELIKDQRLNKLVPRYIGSAADHYAFALAFSVLAAGEDSATPPPRAVDKDDLMFAGQPVTASWTGVGRGRGWRSI